MGETVAHNALLPRCRRYIARWLLLFTKICIVSHRMLAVDSCL